MKRYVVPSLALPQTLAEITAGAAPAIGTGDVARTLGPAPSRDPDRVPAGQATTVASAARQPAPPPPTARMRHLFKVLARAGVTDDQRHGWAAGWLGRPVVSFVELNDDDVLRLISQAETEAGADDLVLAASDGAAARVEGARLCALCGVTLTDGRPVRRGADGFVHVECAA